MTLLPEAIRDHLINVHGFENVPQSATKLYRDNVYRLSHPLISPHLNIKRKGPNRLVLALKYENKKPLLDTVDGISSAHQLDHSSAYAGYKKTQSLGEYSHLVNPSIVEPPARGYDFSTTKALDQLMNIVFGLSPKAEAEDHATNETERKALVKVRLGQSQYRKDLLEYWEGCAVTGCTNESMLIASHIKPWAVDRATRLDKFNGLMLIPNLDTAFDKGLISFNDDGQILISPKIKEADREFLGLKLDMKLRHIDPQHKKYLSWHRKNYKFE